MKASTKQGKQKLASELLSMAKELIGNKQAASPRFDNFVEKAVFDDLSDDVWSINTMMNNYQNRSVFDKYGIDPTNEMHIKEIKKIIKANIEEIAEDAIEVACRVVDNYVHNILRQIK